MSIRDRLAEERRARAQKLLDKLRQKQGGDDGRDDDVMDGAYLQDCEC